MCSLCCSIDAGSTHFHVQAEPTIMLFGALCGATGCSEPPMPLHAAHFYTSFLSQLHAAVAAPSASERATGKHTLRLEAAVAVAEACLDGCLDPADHSKLLARLRIQADGEDADAQIDLGACFSPRRRVRAVHCVCVGVTNVTPSNGRW
jgi:hypothetical protein